MFGNNARISQAARLLSLAASLAALAGFAGAQTETAPAPAPPPPGPHMMMSLHGPGMGGEFFHEEIVEDKVVTGAPVTLTMSTTHDQTLSDGNTIHTENQSTIYRDSQGRTRREVEFELNTPATGSAKHTMVIISDPVAGKRYMLNPQRKVAHEMPQHGPRAMAFGTAGPGAPGPEMGVSVGGPEGPGPMWKGDSKNVTTEQLGTKAIMGLQAQGTRVTRTIPAGEIGNAKPINVVTEHWYSTELQLPLAMTHTDPMMGTMSRTVTNVNRGEPDASLFQVPSDYQLKSGKQGDVLYMRKP